MTSETIKCTVNGRIYEVTVSTGTLLSDLIRDQLFLTGTKRGCETGTCGACSVLLNGKAVKSCLHLAVQADGMEIKTIEGFSDGDRLHPLQESFMEHGGLQCGYCTPGMIVAAADLLANNPRPTINEIRAGLSGNLCRCTGYTQIVEAIEAAARVMETEENS